MTDDYDVSSNSIQCHADKAGATIFTIEESGQRVKVLAFDRAEAKELAEPLLRQFRHETCLDLTSDYETECWCGAKGKVSELYDVTGLDYGCGGLGVLNCYCGGDLCVCHYHGETDCPGCPDCEDGDDYLE